MARPNPRAAIPPIYTTIQAIPLLRRQLERATEIGRLRWDSPEATSWTHNTTVLLGQVFGSPQGEQHENTTAFENAYGGGIYVGMEDHEIQQNHETRTKTRQTLLSGFIEQLGDLPPAPNDAGSPEETAVKTVASIRAVLDRFHLFVRRLRQRYDGRPPIEVNDEYDVQDLLHGILSLHFDDVRPEEVTPSYAGKSSRMDFLLKRERIVIEAKKTRHGLEDKEVGSQLIEDVARYGAHADCEHLICFVYDPENRIGNAQGLVDDLEKLSGSVKVHVVITPR